MRALPLLVLAVPYAFAGPQEVEPSIAAELQALIEKTNALPAFHLVLVGSEEETLELAYREPWGARLTLKTPFREQGVCLDERRRHAIDLVDGGWSYFDLPRSDTLQTLDELFPLGRRLGPGAVFELRGEEGFGCDVAFDLSGRDSPFGWFARMQSDLANVTRTAEELVWTEDTLELHLSRATGLPQAIVVTQAGRELELRLQECQTDEEEMELDELLAPPEDAELDELMTQAHALLILGPQALRQAGFERVEGQLRAEKRAWNAGTRADWESYAIALHGAAIEHRWQPWLEFLRKQIDDNAAWARKELESLDSSERRAALEGYLEDYGRELENGFTSARETYVGELLEIDSEAAEQRGELLDLEGQVIERLHEERIAAPIRAYVEEQFEAVIEGE